MVFALDAATFVASFLFIRPIVELDVGTPVEERAAPAGFLAAFRIPFVRAFAPATLIATLGLGALFSVGIVFVRQVLHASAGEFGVLIALFGVGAAGGLALLGVIRHDAVHVVRRGLALQGVVIATMSLAPSLGFAYLGAVLFGAATSATLAAAMSAVQELLRDDLRVTGFAAFHVIIRVGLSLAAIGAGIAADLVDGQRWPGVGRLPPSRVVLLGSGLVVLLGAALLAPLLRRERFVTVAPGSSPVAGVPVEEEPVGERPPAVAADGRVPGDALHEHRDHDRGRSSRRASTTDPVEEGHHHEIRHEAADRGLAREPTDDEPAEEGRGPRPGLDEERTERR